MKRMDENEITRLCNLARVLVVAPREGKFLTGLVLKPEKFLLAGMPVKPMYFVLPHPSLEFKKAVSFLRQASKRLPANPLAVGKTAQVAEKMLKSKNCARAEAGRALLWAVQNWIIRDMRLGTNDRKISVRDRKAVIRVMFRMLRADL